jgi:type I restriction enzyme S subunit
MTDREVAFNQQINALVPRQGDPHFLYAQIRVGKRLIREASTDGMKGMVSKSRFENILLPFPPIALQRDFAQQFVAIERLKTTHRASLAKLDALFAVLQHRAFRGEL